ncbi:MAG: hypothetical protein IJH78_01330 [Clostridia bacterium]|nr:hypothetical protein [Clostridia bacterium]
MVYAGLDVGTSGCKLVAYDLDGREVFSASRRYTESGTGGLRELDPAVVKDAVRETLREAGQNCPEPIRALAVASMGETVVCLDAQDRPLMGAMLTGDSRGIPQTARLIREAGGEAVFRVTGLPPNELYSLPKWMWIHEETDVFPRTEKILFFEDYVGYLLTGKRMVSYFSAARSLSFDITKKRWDADLLALAGLKPSQLSEPVPPFTVIGTILPEAARELCLPPDMKVVVGGHDQSCAAFGSGLSGMETGECGMGTCEFMFIMLPEPQTTPYMLENDFTCIPYVLKDTYLTSLEITTCGILKNWARDNLFAAIRDECGRAGKNFFAEMDRRAQHTDTEVLLLPQFGSSGNPHLSMDARGTVTGLTIHTAPEDIYRAILEGMAFQSYLAYRRLLPLGVRMENITATGGGAASDLALQIRADVFGCPVRTLRNDESGTLGCMMMAAVADGAYRDAGEAFRRAVHTGRTFMPDPGRHASYGAKYRKYERLYEAMHIFD